MVEIPSPSLHEEDLALCLADEMSRMGYSVRRDSVGNIIGTIGQGRPRVLLCGHMDTVAVMIPVKVEKGVLHGRGSVDAKAPLASMIVAASRAAIGFKGTLIVAGVIDEEGQNRGIHNLIKDDPDYDFAIFGEPTNVDTITVGYKGNLAFKIVCETVTGHSSAPWMFENSIEKAMEIWSEIKDLSKPPNADSYFNSVTGCIRRISGGQENNIVPSWCEIQIDMRIPPNSAVETLEAQVTKVLQAYRDRNPKVRVSYKRIDCSEPYLSPPHTPVAKALISAIYKLRGVQVHLITRAGTGDMNIFGHETGVPSITYGPGDSHFDHTTDEQIQIKDYVDSIDVLTEALRHLSKIYEKRDKIPPDSGKIDNF